MQESISNFSEKISVFLDKNHDIAFLIFIGHCPPEGSAHRIPLPAA